MFPVSCCAMSTEVRARATAPATTTINLGMASRALTSRVRSIQRVVNLFFLSEREGEGLLPGKDALRTDQIVVTRSPYCTAGRHPSPVTRYRSERSEAHFKP